MAENPARIRSDWLLVPHHGSRTSSSAAFLDAVQPAIALAQSGYRNRFGHPAPDVVQRYVDRGIALSASPACGALTWRSVAPSVVRCERTAAPHYWRHDVAPVDRNGA
jgi:competence protein ComEC